MPRPPISPLRTSFLLALIPFVLTAPGLQFGVALAEDPPPYILQWSSGDPREMDVDEEGHLYVLNRNSSSIRVYTSNGGLIGEIPYSFPGNLPRGLAVSDDAVYMVDGSVRKFSKTGTLEWSSTQTDLAGAATDESGNLYTCSQYNGVLKFTPNGSVVATIGSIGTEPGQFFEPSIVAVSPQGEVFVADQYLDTGYRIQRFSSAGSYLGGWNTPGRFFVGMDFGPNATLYLTEGQNHLVEKRDYNGNVLSTFNGGGSPGGYFLYPHGIAVTETGELFVADWGNNRIQKFGANELLSPPSYALRWGSQGTGPSQFTYPLGLSVDATGHVYVADHIQRKVKQYSSTGSLINQWETTGSNLPADHLAIGTDHRVYVIGGSERVEVFSASGEFQQAWNVNGAFSLQDIAAGPDGNLYIADHGPNLVGGAVLKYSPSGSLLATIAGPGFDDGEVYQPTSLTVDQQGNVYVFSGDGGTSPQRIQKFNSQGAFLDRWMQGFPGTSAIGGVDHNGNIITLVGAENKVRLYSPNGLIVSEWGATGTGKGQFGAVQDVVADHLGNYYVLDFGSYSIQKFGTADTAQPPSFVLKWGTAGSGQGQLNQPWGLTVGNNSVYVADRANNRIQRFTKSGGFLASWGSTGSGNGQFQTPYDVAAGPSGDVYVADRDNHRIQKFSANGTYVDQWGGLGSGNGQLNQPRGVAVDVVGNVYVADTDNNRIQKFSSAGVYLTQWGSLGSGDGQFDGPVRVATDLNGAVYVTDNHNHRIQKFSSAGVYLVQWGSQGAGVGQINTPWGIAVGESGDVYLADAGNSRIQRFLPDGRLSVWGTPGTGNGQFLNPIDVAVDNDGNIYVADTDNNRIQKFGTGSGLRPVVMLHGYCDDGTMWVDLGNYLTAQGFSPHAISLTPNNDRPTKLAKQLAEYLDSTFPNQDVDIIAHSMGGLVARQYIRQRKANSRIKSLITLGTPHHGVDLISQAIAMKPISWVFRELFGPCQLDGEALADLANGSDFLNNLNYETTTQIDKRLRSSRGPHPSESTYGAGVNTWCFAGTSHFDGPARRLTAPAWFSTNKWTYSITDYLNDGVVGVDAAALWNNLSQTRLDSQLGLDPIQHTTSLALYGDSRAFKNAADLFPILENLLRGGTAPGGSTQQSSSMLAVEAESDTVPSILLSEGGSLTGGQNFERSIALPMTEYAQITMAAENALFRIRMPNGTLLSPSDTLSLSGLHYAEDEALGLAIYGIDNPVPGTWAAVIDASAAGTAQKYAIAAEAVGTLVPMVEVVNNSTTTSARIIRASLEDVGTPQLGVTWTTTVMRPDSATFLIDLFDDGGHQDLLANDGVYGAQLNLPGQLGFYLISASGVPTGSTVSYVATTLAELTEFKDLAIDSTLGFSRNSIPAGDSLVVSGVVRNFGTAAVNEVVVELWDNHVKVATTTLNLIAGGDASVGLNWKAAAPDTHLIELIVNPFVVPDETESDNNVASHQVVLGQPIVGVEPGHMVRRFQLGPVAPNPFVGQTTIHFSIPTAGQVTLGIYDVVGRQVRKWLWQDLSVGPLFVNWDGRSSAGAKLSPGVYFLRLDVNGARRTAKTILLK